MFECINTPEFSFRARDWLTDEVLYGFPQIPGTSNPGQNDFLSQPLTDHVVISYVVCDNDDTMQLLLLLLLLTFHFVSGK
jgi:hypothetical protein